MRRLTERLLNVLRPARADEDAAREIASHLALLEDDYLRRGLAADEARRAARLALGGVAQTNERHRDARALAWIDDARRDVRYAARSLARNPAFSIVAVVTLALGIGANTAIFSIVHAVILSPLPFKNADQLVQLYENVPAAESANGKAMRTVVFARDVIDLSMHARTLSDVVTTGTATLAVQGGADAQRQKLTSVTVATFSMLGVQPKIGRWFSAGDDASGRDRDVFLSCIEWQRCFGGDAHTNSRWL